MSRSRDLSNVLSGVSANLVFADGSGIDFNAAQSSVSGTTPSATAVLDDYEEGTWTPTFYTSGTATFSYGNQDGHYIKFGNVVIAGFHLFGDVSNTDGSGLRIGGLPFTANGFAGDGIRYSGSLAYSRYWAGPAPAFLAVSGGSIITLIASDADEIENGFVLDTDMTSGSGTGRNQLRGSVVYIST